MNYPFSLVFNDGSIFPELPRGEVLIYGKHHKTFAKCDYDGEMNISHPHVNGYATEDWVFLATDSDSVMAWHGERKKEGHYYKGKISWEKALRREQRDSNRRD